MKTVSARQQDVERKWFLVDAQGKTLGRLASDVAKILRGKHKPIYTPHVDTGDFVVVVNAEKVRLTGRKRSDKMYHRHTGWVGGIVSESAERKLETHPDSLVKLAVWGMLPKGPLGRKMFKKLKVYVGGEHPHAAQKPEALAVG